MVKFAVDESLFISYNNNMQYLAIGIINVVSRAIRFEISPIRDTTVIKEIIKTHMKSGKVVIYDNWAAYYWISNPDFHHVHTHGHGDFDAGSDSTSHIEKLWAHLKSIIKKYIILYLQKISYYF